MKGFIFVLALFAVALSEGGSLNMASRGGVGSLKGGGGGLHGIERN